MLSFCSLSLVVSLAWERLRTRGGQRGPQGQRASVGVAFGGEMQTGGCRLHCSVRPSGGSVSVGGGISLASVVVGRRLCGNWRGGGHSGCKPWGQRAVAGFHQ